MFHLGGMFPEGGGGGQENIQPYNRKTNFKDKTWCFQLPWVSSKILFVDVGKNGALHRSSLERSCGLFGLIGFTAVCKLRAMPQSEQSNYFVLIKKIKINKK